MQQKKIIIHLFLVLSYGAYSQSALPKGFMEVQTVIPDLVIDLRYAKTNNFVGQKVPGYHAEKAILSMAATTALVKVQNELKIYGFGIKFFDGYRPQQAVNHFVHWAKNQNDTLMKAQYYPNLSKSMLFEQQYIASRSGHSRGSSVDLTLIDFNTCLELDMGSPYDFFGEISNLDYSKLTPKQVWNRQLLQKVMKRYGFRSYAQEWWHFTLIDEPFPNTYFNFPID